MSDQVDPTSLVLTMFMVAFLRLVDAMLALQAGIPIDKLRPRPLAELDEEARTYVEQILAGRGQGDGA